MLIPMRIYEHITNIRTKKIISFITIALLIFIDQLSKYLVRQGGGFYICNEGIAFGIYLPQIWLWLLILLFLIVFLVFKVKKNRLISNYSLILIMAGAISNIIDRLYFGCIIDFVTIFPWTIFNLADAFIFIGVIITISLVYKNKN